MVEITPDEIRAVASEFEDVDDDKINFYIESARDYVNEGRWGQSKAKRGIMLMAMHLMSRFGVNQETDDNGQILGAIISESVGGVTTTYAQPVGAADGSTLSLTPYGEQFNLLKATIIRTPLVT